MDVFNEMEFHNSVIN